jgi:hypothetical protein
MQMDRPGGTPRWRIWCEQCGGESGPGLTPDTARSGWNVRAESDELRRQIDEQQESFRVTLNSVRAELAEVNAAAHQMQIAIACYLHLQVARGGVGRISVSKYDMVDLPDVLKGELETWSDHEEIVLRLKPAEACKAVKP